MAKMGEDEKAIVSMAGCLIVKAEMVVEAGHSDAVVLITLSNGKVIAIGTSEWLWVEER